LWTPECRYGKHEKLEVLFTKAAVCQTKASMVNNVNVSKHKTQSFSMSFPLKWVNDFIAVSAHFQAKKVASFDVLSKIFYGSMRQLN